MTGTFGTGRPRWVDMVLLSIGVFIFLTLIGLGTWQLQRLEWKLALIEAVDQRAFGDPVEPPDLNVTAAEHAYLRVAVRGAFSHDRAQRVKAVTDLGPGHWVMTPLRTDEMTVWVNRGFVPLGMDRKKWTAPETDVVLQGLLRITEPDGTLLERNDPQSGRWVSRDVAALSVHAGLRDVAPYFIDADHLGESQDWPRGGLTKVSFRNPHLSYALTWYAMAALLFGGMVYAVYDGRRASNREV